VIWYRAGQHDAGDDLVPGGIPAEQRRIEAVTELEDRVGDESHGCPRHHVAGHEQQRGVEAGRSCAAGGATAAQAVVQHDHR
jgi:hypothetical protein